MIYLQQGQVLFDNAGMVVYDPTGYYNDGDTVTCAGVGTPDEPVCRYEAQYIMYGGMVYSISDPDALMAAILAIDPNSLFGKTQQQVAVDTAVQSIVPNDTAQTPDILDNATSTTDDQSATSTPDSINSDSSQISTSTPDDTTITDPDTSQVSTSTPDNSIDTDMSSSTSEVVLPDDTQVSTTTPDTSLPDLDIGSSTSATTTPVDITSTSTDASQ